MISIGALLVIIGAALAAWQWQIVWAWLVGFLPLLLLALGILFLLIGYSQRKAKKFYRANVTQPDTDNAAP